MKNIENLVSETLLSELCNAVKQTEEDSATLHYLDFVEEEKTSREEMKTLSLKVFSKYISLGSKFISYSMPNSEKAFIKENYNLEADGLLKDAVGNEFKQNIEKDIIIKIRSLGEVSFKNGLEFKYDKEIKYEWSSYQDFALKNRWDKLIVPQIITDQFKDMDGYKKFIETSTAKMSPEDFRI